MTEKPASIVPKAAVALAVLVVAVVAFGAVMFKKASAPAVDELLALLPKDTAGFVLVRGLPALALELGEAEGLFDAEFRETVDGDVREAIEHVEKTLDVDLSKVSAVSDIGLDLLRPAGAAMTMIRAQPVGSLYLPATDATKLSLNLRKLVESDGTAVESANVGGNDVFYVSSGEEVAWMPYEDRVLLAISDEEGLARRLLEDTVQQRDVGLGEQTWVQSLRPLVDGSWQAFLGVDPDLPDELMKELPREFRRALREEAFANLWNDLEGFALAVDGGKDNVVIHTRVAAEEGGDLRFDATNGARKDSLGDRIPGTALFAGRMSVDIGKTLELLSKEDEIEEEFEQAVREIRKETGVDVEDDVLAQLGSPVSFAVFESERSARMPLGAAAWVPLKPEHTVGKAIEDFDAALKDERVDVDRDTVGDVQWRRISEDGISVGWGVARDHLVLVFGKNLLDEVAGGMAETKTSYLDGVGEAARPALRSEGDTVLYVDTEEVLRALRPQLERDRDFRELLPVLEEIDDALLTATTSTRAADLTLELRSEGGFGK